MFGSTSQKPGGFSFGASSGAGTGLNNNQTNNFSFGNNNNNTATTSTTSAPQSSGLLFGNNATNTQTNTLPPSSTNGFKGGLGGGLFNKPVTSTGTATGGLGFGGNSTNIGTKPALFGNSSTNPAFGGNSLSAGLGQNALQPQQQNSSIFNTDYSKLSEMEMPKPLTSASTDDSALKLKRRRSSSFSKQNENGKEPSMVGKLVESFKTPSKYSIENFRGLFTSNNNKNNGVVESNKNGMNIDEQIKEYSNKLGLNIPKVPASKSEYRRLIIKHPNDTFKKFSEIDANAVLLARGKKHNLINNFQFSTENKSEKTIIESLKPKSKRVKTENNFIDDNNIELTFSKPLNDQLPNNNIRVEESTNVPASPESEYWCIPSIEDLSKKNSLELTHVENFTAGRKGYGSLMFKYPVDLSAFECRWDELLGKTIVIRNKILQVYPDESEKPSQGNGLNIPAVITLEKTYPAKYDPMNPDIELLENHIERLKSVHGMKFISFDPITGNYVFEVEHFSIWGIVDEDEHDEELISKWRKQQEDEYQNEKRKNELQINALEKIAGYGQPGDNWKRQKTDLGIVNPGEFLLNDEDDDEGEGNDTEIKHDLLLDANNKNEDELEEELVDASVPSSLYDDENLEAKALALVNRGVEGIEDLVEVRAHEPEVKDVMNLQFLKSKKELAVSDDWDEQLALAKGFFSVFNKNLDKSYDLKTDPKSVGEFIFGGKDTSKLTKAIVEPPLRFENSNEYSKYLKSATLSDKYEMRDSGLPKVEINSTISLKIPLLSFESCEDYNIWELLSILYDENFVQSFMSDNVYKVCDNDTSSFKFNHIANIKRRELLCQFLQKIALIDFENVNTSDPLEKIYHFVCTGKISDAIQYAINTRNNHIAVLLTMMDSNDEMVHELARGQLKEWSNGSISFIPSGVLKIYKLLSGDIFSKNYVDHLEGLSWPIILFLLLKYGDTNKALNVTIGQFVEYFENNGLVDTTNNEIYYLLLKMVNSSDSVLSKFEVELQFSLMKYLGYAINFKDDYFDEIVEKFAAKLEKKEMIEEALFVLEHHHNDAVYEKLITDLLYNNVNKLDFLVDNNKLNGIHQRLHLPKNILHEARSFEFNNRKEYYLSVLELISADNKKSGHQILLEHVAPEIIISNNKERLDKLSKLIGEFEYLSEFKTGAGVYADYIDAVGIASELNYDNKNYDNDCASLKEKIDSVLNGIPLLKDLNSKVKIAKTLMMKKLINVTSKKNLQYTSQQLACIDLPESERNYLESKFDTGDVKMLEN